VRERETHSLLSPHANIKKKPVHKGKIIIYFARTNFCRLAGFAWLLTKIIAPYPGRLIDRPTQFSKSTKSPRNSICHRISSSDSAPGLLWLVQSNKRTSRPTTKAIINPPQPVRPSPSTKRTCRSPYLASFSPPPDYFYCLFPAHFRPEIRKATSTLLHRSPARSPRLVPALCCAFNKTRALRQSLRCAQRSRNGVLYHACGKPSL
jgi:hypothetical protein